MKIYITGLPSGYEVEHLARLFYPMAPLTLTPPEPAEDSLWAEKTDTGLRVLVRQGEKSKMLEAPLPLPVEQGGETPEFALASLTYDLLRSWTGVRPPWGKMTGVRPVRLIHDKRAAGWSAEQIDRFFLQRFDCSEQKYEMAKEIADLQEPILRLGSAPKTYSLYIGIPFCPSRCSYCSFVSCNLDRDRKLVQPYVDCLCREVEAIRDEADKAGLMLCSIYIGGGTPTSLSAAQLRQLMGTVRENFDLSKVVEYTVEAGRPDCTDAEKLAVIKEYGATRISINPQTFSDEVLAGIGRKHSAQDILDCYAEARKAKEFRFIQAEKGGDTIVNGKIEYQDADGNWTKIGDVNGNQKQIFELDSAATVKAVRITNLAQTSKWWKVYDLSATKIDEPGTVTKDALNAKIAEAEKVDSADWTKSSREALADAIAAAKAVAADQDATQAKVDAAVAALESAMKGVERYTAKTAYQLKA